MNCTHNTQWQWQCARIHCVCVYIVSTVGIGIIKRTSCIHSHIYIWMVRSTVFVQRILPKRQNTWHLRNSVLKHSQSMGQSQNTDEHIYLNQRIDTHADVWIHNTKQSHNNSSIISSTPIESNITDYCFVFVIRIANREHFECSTEQQQKKTDKENSITRDREAKKNVHAHEKITLVVI